MPTNRKRVPHRRRVPPIDKVEWLWALGREEEALALQPFLPCMEAQREPEIWAAHSEAIMQEWLRDNPPAVSPRSCSGWRRPRRNARKHDCGGSATDNAMFNGEGLRLWREMHDSPFQYGAARIFDSRRGRPPQGSHSPRTTVPVSILQKRSETGAAGPRNSASELTDALQGERHCVRDT